ncbi:M23 family metallopeptidase [Candidatus Parcubacteria bacterium]|nr:MAG: M23 family metallopeptidase [Candidatus Parcubacteria bacterium]
MRSISTAPTIAKNIRESKALVGKALFLLCVAVLQGILWYGADSRKGILGGPVETKKVLAADIAPPRAVLSDIPFLREEEARDAALAMQGQLLPSSAEESATLRAPGNPLGVLAGSPGVVIYHVKKGDTLSGIANRFGISLRTVTAANPEVRARALHIGQSLYILPVAGVVYTALPGDTLEGIAKKFGVAADAIRQYNRTLENEGLRPGMKLAIPGVVPEVKAGRSYAEARRYFIQPTQGLNWGKRHSRNAVDIANACGTEVDAAAEGLVVDVGRKGWNSGYGHYVTIEHPNGAKTKYAHLGEIVVAIGDYVAQGQKIAEMGNTGNVHGPTGCHLHFEVYGMANPFVR